MYSAAIRFLCLSLIIPVLLISSVAGRIRGTVSDSSGAVIAHAIVSATNLDTGAKLTVSTDMDGAYSFPVLAAGHYTLEITFPRLASYRRIDITVNANSSLVIDATLESAREKQTVNVTDSAVHVETASTQLGEVISGREMTAVPLNGRSFTDLLPSSPE